MDRRDGGGRDAGGRGGGGHGVIEMTLREWIERERSLGHIAGPLTRGHGRGGGEGRYQVNESSSSEEEFRLRSTKKYRSIFCYFLLFDATYY